MSTLYGELKKPVSTRYEELAIQVGRLVDKKQAAYGDSFGKAGAVLRLMYPNGITTGQYDDMLCLVRIIDKLFRIATDRDALGESPFQDVAGYALLGLDRVEVELNRYSHPKIMSGVIGPDKP